jgi:hypothetical protein
MQSLTYRRRTLLRVACSGLLQWVLRDFAHAEDLAAL